MSDKSMIVNMEGPVKHGDREFKSFDVRPPMKNEVRSIPITLLAQWIGRPESRKIVHGWVEYPFDKPDQPSPTIYPTHGPGTHILGWDYLRPGDPNYDWGKHCIKWDI